MLSRSTCRRLKTPLSVKVADKTRNQFVAGILYWLFNRDIKISIEFLKEKFKDKPELIKANVAVLRAGYNYAETIEAMAIRYMIKPTQGRKGKFRNITGNVATAWGLMAAAEKAGKNLFLGSYPITPASEILQELSLHKNLGVKTFQAEDEIAGICSAIGASFAGNLAVTTTSGPGLALKGEALGLAVITELPLVVINVQRGGPSTGLPTKTEQSDLMQALYGRSGDCPVVVIAADTPANCFKYSFIAAKLAIEHMTPVILLTDGYLANGSELLHISKIKEAPNIKVPSVKDNDTEYQPYLRDPEKLSRYWALPGQKGLRHKIGGLEKADITGEVSQDPYNHEFMTKLREEKVQRVKNYIPEQKLSGESHGDLLVIGWGGTFGVLKTAVDELRKEGFKISFANFNYIKPLPKNTEDILKSFNKRIVCEMNLGQFANYLRMNFPQYDYMQFNKVQGLPFFIYELKKKFKQILEEM